MLGFLLVLIKKVSKMPLGMKEDHDEQARKQKKLTKKHLYKNHIKMYIVIIFKLHIFVYIM